MKQAISHFTISHSKLWLVLAIGLTAFSVGWSSNARAVTLGECTGDGCTCDEEYVGGAGYDYCAVTQLPDIPYPDLPCQYREYLGVTVSYEDGQYDIHAEIPDDHRVVLAPQHEGQFSSYAELETYIQKLLFGIGCPNAPIDWPRPDTCNANTWNINQSGPIYRWVVNEEIGNFGGYWAKYQPENFLNAALFDTKGKLSIEDLDIILDAVRSKQCITGQDGDLKATQCSAAYSTTGASVAEQVCDTDEVTVFDTPGVNTEEKDIEWQGSKKEIVAAEDETNFGWGFRIRDIQTNEIRIQNWYYDENGAGDPIPNQGLDNDEERSWSGVHGGRMLERLGPHGVCGDGLVKRGVYQVTERTDAGTGNGHCPWD